MAKRTKKTSRKTNKKAKTAKKFNLLDYFCIITGIIISVVIILFYHENPPLYTFAGIVALNGGILGTILGIKGYRSNFIISFITAFACGYTSQVNHFLGNAIINVFFYAPFCLLGFYLWSKHQNNKKVIARKFTPKQTVFAILMFIVSVVVLNRTLSFFGGEQAILDSSATVLVVFATILSVFRYRETWACWFFSDILQLIMWTTTNDPAVLALRIFFPLSAVYGFINWKTLLKPSKK